jgi:hypothetical protein
MSLRFEGVAMTNGENELCLKCEHSKSEHVSTGCNHLDDMGPQEHGNPEKLLRSCDGFMGSKTHK